MSRKYKEKLKKVYTYSPNQPNISVNRENRITNLEKRIRNLKSKNCLNNIKQKKLVDYINELNCLKNGGNNV